MKENSNEKFNNFCKIKFKWLGTVCNSGENFWLKYKNAKHLNISKCNPNFRFSSNEPILVMEMSKAIMQYETIVCDIEWWDVDNKW